ncbi:permease prefix domain 1-containing protein [Neobacillus mesonae]|uniref:permease prefix domain 1-containing protein n=1 Tax=Neobacillus mesonae TaxID=1193713 RepID=UPI002E1E4AE0|nr:permease prefix domain 1-containing protein [Neobacillus mesonae]
MKSKLEQYVENIVQHTECSKKEKEDLYEELLIHLQLSRDSFIAEEGLTPEMAEEKAIQQFGKEGKIGTQLQQAIFPYRKELMLALAISSILFTISLYLLRLFVEGDTHFGWLCFSMGTCAMLLFFPLNQSLHINRKLWLNSLLIFHTLGVLYGWLLTSYLNHPASTGLTIWLWLNIALGMALVYRTTIYDYSFHEKSMKILHGINIISGVIIIVGSLFFIWGGLIMIGTFHPMMLVFASPIAIWIGMYIAQIKLAKKNKGIALVLGSIPFIGCILIILYFYSPAFI